uniref:FCP1 homology domain-containing protein n=1 Tax=Panagrellus redivivus TaxID=6233 RepID=A0A7E4W0B4_PANRE
MCDSEEPVSSGFMTGPSTSSESSLPPQLDTVDEDMPTSSSSAPITGMRRLHVIFDFDGVVIIPEAVIKEAPLSYRINLSE